MIVFDPQQLATWTKGFWLEERLPPPLTGFSQDTRTLQAGEGFVALIGDSRDGHDFLEAAEAADAQAALVSRQVTTSSLPQLCVPDVLSAFQVIARQHRLIFPGKIIGVTGSCGKTSTTALTATLLGTEVLKTPKNWNNQVGVPLTLMRLDPLFQRFAVVEAGINQRGEMDTLAQMIRPDLIIYTMVGEAHLEGLGNLHTIAREKARLAQLAQPDAPVLFPANCLRYPEFRVLGTRAWVAAPYGTELPEGSFHRLFYTVDPQETGGCRVKILPSPLPSGHYELSVSSPGLISNAVLAIAAAQLCGASVEAIASRLQQETVEAHRGVWVKTETCLIYDDTYNANPSSMAESLVAFIQGSPEAQPRLFVLAGMKELGKQASALHAKVGYSLPVRDGDHVIFIGDEAESYREGLKARGFSERSTEVFSNTQEASEVIQGFVGSVFLKGSRTYRLESLVQKLESTQKTSFK